MNANRIIVPPFEPDSPAMNPHLQAALEHLLALAEKDEQVELSLRTAGHLVKVSVWPVSTALAAHPQQDLEGPEATPAAQPFVLSERERQILRVVRTRRLQAKEICVELGWRCNGTAKNVLSRLTHEQGRKLLEHTPAGGYTASALGRLSLDASDADNRGALAGQPHGTTNGNGQH